MGYPELLEHPSPEEYRAHFESVYCRGPIRTFDGIEVRFRRRNFNHAFFESSRRDQTKDNFSKERARRMDWIKAALEDAQAELYQGYDRRKKCWDPKRRVALTQTNYVVVIRMVGKDKAEFVTAFVADDRAEGGRHLSTVQKIRLTPKWQ